MQYILSVDTTVDPAQAVVVRINGKQLEVVERQSFSLAALFQGESSEDSASSSLEAEEHPAPQSDGGNGVTGPGSAVDFDFIRNFSSPWTNAILIIPAQDYLSLNLDLPFSDPRNINKILDLEVQDVVPFDISEFLVQHRAIASSGAKNHDVHVSIIPKLYIKRTIEFCRKLGFEPLIISTPSSVAAAVYHLAPEYFARNSILVVPQDPHYYLTLCYDGQVRTERMLQRSDLEDSSSSNQMLLQELKLNVASMEKRYGGQVAAVYFLGEEASRWPKTDLQQALGRKVEYVDLHELVKLATSDQSAGNQRVSSNGHALAGLAAYFAQDTGAPAILTDFRTREFSYRPPLTALLKGLRSLTPLITATIALSVLALAVSFGVRNRQAAYLRSAIHNQVVSNMPDLDVAEGSEVAALQKEIGTLEEQLKDFGSPTAMNPLEVLQDLSSDFPVSNDLFLQQLSIRGNKIRIDGVAPDYAAVEKVERLLDKKKKQKLYCRIKKEAGALGAAAAGSRTFSYEIILCD